MKNKSDHGATDSAPSNQVNLCRCGARTETVTPILRDRILGEYELDRGNGMSHRMAYANVLGTVPVVHEKIIEVLREAGISR